MGAAAPAEAVAAPFTSADTKFRMPKGCYSGAGLPMHRTPYSSAALRHEPPCATKRRPRVRITNTIPKAGATQGKRRSGARKGHKGPGGNDLREPRWRDFDVAIE
ncbi:hypothetical protein Stsp01_39490 [Streptomyces sp. NBRC 13847]|nr:hypothetical protein Stsp01_39490 [Streptomyces sp. NBRC 13847]